jgi:hypothetical protein
MNKKSKYKHTLGVYYLDLVAYYKIENDKKIKE